MLSVTKQFHYAKYNESPHSALLQMSRHDIYQKKKTKLVSMLYRPYLQLLKPVKNIYKKGERLQLSRIKSQFTTME